MLHIWLQHLSLLFTCSGSLMAEKNCKWRYLAFTGNSSILLARMGLLCYLVYNDSTVKQPQLAEVNTKEVSLPASLQSPTFTDSFGNGCHFTCLVYHCHSSRDWVSQNKPFCHLWTRFPFAGWTPCVAETANNSMALGCALLHHTAGIDKNRDKIIIINRFV